MPDKQTGNTSRHAHAAHEAPVRYLDPGALARPLDMPRTQRIQMLAFVAVAVLIGVLIFNNVTSGMSSGSSAASGEVAQIIAENGDLDLSVLADYTINDADGIKSRLSDAGITYYDNSKSSDDELELVRVPDGLNSSEVKSILTSGLSSVDTATAARYICGTWRLTGNFDSGVDLRVRYCDLSATTASAALTDAAKSQGYTIPESAQETTDSAGNTSVSGTVDYDGTTYAWTISACDLSNVYNVSGIPGTAQYVGIHLYAN